MVRRTHCKQACHLIPLETRPRCEHLLPRSSPLPRYAPSIALCCTRSSSYSSSSRVCHRGYQGSYTHIPQTATATSHTHTLAQLGSTTVGVRTPEGVVLGVEKRVQSPLLESSSIEKIM